MFLRQRADEWEANVLRITVDIYCFVYIVVNVSLFDVLSKAMGTERVR